MESPGRSMSVNELYDWFERKSSIMGDREKKNWHNNIRQALSTKRVRPRIHHLICCLTLHSNSRRWKAPGKERTNGL